MKRLFLAIAVFIVVSVVALSCAGRFDDETPQKAAPKEIDRISALVEQWLRRDGYRFLVIGEQLFEENLEHPNAFYKAMSGKDAAFQDYVRTLPTTCFTNQNDTATAYLEKRRVEAIQRLETAKVESVYDDMHRAVLDTLVNLTVRYID